VAARRVTDVPDIGYYLVTTSLAEHMHMSRSIARHGRLLLVAAAWALGACAEPLAPPTAPDLVGVISSVAIEGNAVVLMVESLTVPTAGYSRIVLQVRGPGVGAEVYVQEASGLRLRDASEALRVGARIQAWSTGVERRSDPPQWDARRIHVLAER